MWSQGSSIVAVLPCFQAASAPRPVERIRGSQSTKTDKHKREKEEKETLQRQTLQPHLKLKEKQEFCLRCYKDGRVVKSNVWNKEEMHRRPRMEGDGASMMNVGECVSKEMKVWKRARTARKQKMYEEKENALKCQQIPPHSGVYLWWISCNSYTMSQTWEKNIFQPLKILHIRFTIVISSMVVLL